MNIKERKIELRKQMAKLRATLSESERTIKTAAINDTLIREVTERLASARADRRPPTLFTYMPHKTEVDVTPVMEECWARGYRVVIPKSFPEQRQMRLHEIRTYRDIASGAYGIQEPMESLPTLQEIDEVDVILVPGLAFDLQFGRLGYGGGYYDRFIQRYVRANRPKPYLIAGAFDLQIIPEVPLGLFDFRVHHLVTETRSVKAALNSKERK